MLNTAPTSIFGGVFNDIDQMITETIISGAIYATFAVYYHLGDVNHSQMSKILEEAGVCSVRAKDALVARQIVVPHHFYGQI